MMKKQIKTQQLQMSVYDTHPAMHGTPNKHIWMGQ